MSSGNLTEIMPTISAVLFSMLALISIGGIAFLLFALIADWFEEQQMRKNRQRSKS